MTKYIIDNFKTINSTRRKSVAYVWPKNETIADSFNNRRSRPSDLWKVMVENELVERGIKFEKITWSQKAGCSCGCSPGFVVKGEQYIDFHMDFSKEG